MKILYFTNQDKFEDKSITSILAHHGHTILNWADKVTLPLIIGEKVDFIVSDRPQSLIKQDVLDYLPNKVINLHPAFLPWNRGYHPLYFSVRDDNPSGNSIHYIDIGIDTGDIIEREEIYFSEDDTLRTAYDKLRDAMVEMFAKAWPKIEKETNDRSKQEGKSTHYWKRDFDGVYEKLPKGWDTSLNCIKECNE